MYKIPVLDALAAVKNPTAVMAQRALEQVHAQAARRVLQLARELKVRGRGAGAVGATRRHNQRQRRRRQQAAVETAAGRRRRALLVHRLACVLCCASSADSRLFTRTAAPRRAHTPPTDRRHFALTSRNDFRPMPRKEVAFSVFLSFQTKKRKRYK